jgi:glycosyltransferase involved in cell wall biosynthesis
VRCGAAGEQRSRRGRRIVAPNGIAPPEATWDGGSGGYLLWLGRFDPRTKGLDVLIKGIAHMPPADRPELRLHGRDWRNGKRIVQGMIRDEGVQSSVRIGDPIYGAEKWDVLKRAAGFVYPSRWDACPVAVSEAAAVGVPTLVGRYPLGNFLARSDAAVQVDPDPASVSRGIEELVSARGREVAPNGAAVARRELSWETVSESWLDQVRSLLHPAN